MLIEEIFVLEVNFKLMYQHNLFIRMEWKKVFFKKSFSFRNIYFYFNKELSTAHERVQNLTGEIDTILQR